LMPQMPTALCIAVKGKKLFNGELEISGTMGHPNSGYCAMQYTALTEGNQKCHQDDTFPYSRLWVAYISQFLKN
jgi:hypothetical protein